MVSLNQLVEGIQRSSSLSITPTSFRFAPASGDISIGIVGATYQGTVTSTGKRTGSQTRTDAGETLDSA